MEGDDDHCCLRAFCRRYARYGAEVMPKQMEAMSTNLLICGLVEVAAVFAKIAKIGCVREFHGCPWTSFRHPGRANAKLQLYEL